MNFLNWNTLCLVLFPSFSSYFFAPLSHFHKSVSYFSRFVLVLFSLFCFSLLFPFLSPCLFLIYLSVALLSFSLYEPIPFFTLLISLPIPSLFPPFPPLFRISSSISFFFHFPLLLLSITFQKSLHLSQPNSSFPLYHKGLLILIIQV